MAVKASDIKAALLKHYSPPGWRVFFEVSNDTGARARRWIDAVAVGIWPSTGHEIIGIEIKVSRGDFTRELAHPEKAQELMKFCTRWCLACPAGLVSVDEVPANWGVLALQPNGTIRRKKAPPLLEPEPITPGFMMAVLRQHEEPDMGFVNKLVAERMKVETEKNDARIERAAASRVRDVSSEHDRALAIAEKIKQLTGVSIEDWSFDPEAFAAAYLLFRKSNLHQKLDWGAFGNLSAHLASAQQSLNAITNDPGISAIREALGRGEAS